MVKTLDIGVANFLRNSGQAIELNRFAEIASCSPIQNLLFIKTFPIHHHID
jgi:hypothetical protein